MKLSILVCLVAAIVVSAEPWRPRPGRGAYRRDAAAEPFHVRPGDPIYTFVAKRDAEPEAEPEAEAFHVRPGDPIYTFVAKRDAEPEPEAEPWRPRPGRGAY